MNAFAAMRPPAMSQPRRRPGAGESFESMMPPSRGTGAMAGRLAAAGRGGDNMVAHINPIEARVLAQRPGVRPGINPETGLPEFQNPNDLPTGYIPGEGYQYGAPSGATGGAPASQSSEVWQEPARTDTHGAMAAPQRPAIPGLASQGNAAPGRDPSQIAGVRTPPTTAESQDSEVWRGDTHGASAAPGAPASPRMSNTEAADSAVFAARGTTPPARTEPAVAAPAPAAGAPRPMAAPQRPAIPGLASQGNAAPGRDPSAQVGGVRTPSAPDPARAARAQNPAYDTNASGDIVKWNTPAPSATEAAAATWNARGRPAVGTETFETMRPPVGTQARPGALAAAPASRHPATTDPAKPANGAAPTGMRRLTDAQLDQIEQARLAGTWLPQDLLASWTWADKVAFNNKYGYYPHTRIDGGIYQIDGAPPGVVAGKQNAVIGSPDEPQNWKAAQMLGNLTEQELFNIARAAGIKDPYGAEMLDLMSGRVLNVPVYTGTGEGGANSGYQGTFDHTIKAAYETGKVVVMGSTGQVALVPIDTLKAGGVSIAQIKAAMESGAALPAGVERMNTHPTALAELDYEGNPFAKFKQGTPGFGDEQYLFPNEYLPSDYYTNNASPGYSRSPVAGGNSQSVIDKTPTMITPVGANYAIYRYNDGTIRSSNSVLTPITINGRSAYIDESLGLLRDGGGVILNPTTGQPYIGINGISHYDPLRVFGGTSGTGLHIPAGAYYQAPKPSLGTEAIHRGETVGVMNEALGPASGVSNAIPQIPGQIGGGGPPGQSTVPGGGNSTVPGGGNSTVPGGGNTPTPIGGAGAPVPTPSIPNWRQRNNFASGFGPSNVQL